MSVTPGRVTRRLERHPNVTDVQRRFPGDDRTPVSFLTKFSAGGFMGANDGRDASITRSLVNINTDTGTVPRFTLRLPPVKADAFGSSAATKQQLREATEIAVEQAGVTDRVDIEINGDSARSLSEWTPHVLSVPMIGNPFTADETLQMVDEVLRTYDDLVYDPSKTTGFTAPTGGEFAPERHGEMLGAPQPDEMGGFTPERLARASGGGGSLSLFGTATEFNAPGRADSADVFHVTRPLDAEQIAAEGLRRRAMELVEKEARDAAGEDYSDGRAERQPYLDQEPRDVKATRYFDEIVADARREVAPDAPRHESSEAVFFWTNERDAKRAADKRLKGGVIVAVDSRLLPDTARPVKASINASDTIYQMIWDALGTGQTYGRETEEEAYELAKDYWSEVQPYTYDEGNDPFRTAEVWVNVDVPPEAIQAIYRPDTDRVLYDPAGADQRTLREFEAPM